MNKEYLLGIASFNEGEKIKRVLAKFADYDSYDVLLVDDGSTDGSLSHVTEHPFLKFIKNAGTKGAGYVTRQIIQYAKEQGYGSVIFVSGNDKDDPRDTVKLKQGMDDGYDFVQGSRYLPGGAYGGMPLYRTVSTRWMHPVLFSLVTGMYITDSTNGFRAVRMSMLDNSNINLDQDWLDQYELEPYLFYKAVKLGYKVKEVPVKKIYPPKEQGYSKMKPVVGWWSILRPLIYLALGIKQ